MNLFYKISIKILFIIAPYLPDTTYLRLYFRLRMGYWPNLKAPITFSEKLQWLKLHNRKAEYTQMVDKYAVKKYVAKIIGEDYIIPTLAVYDKVDEIDFNSLPNQFVLKCTHDSGGIILCKDKNLLNFNSAKRKLQSSLKKSYFYRNREWPYKNVPHRIILEEFLVDESGYELKDYKFFCFNGNPIFCQVIKGRNNHMTIDFFDKEWNHYPFHEPKSYPFSDTPIMRPHNYEKMLEIASKLSKGHPFIRVDLYDINGNIKFGELTFYPTSGCEGFEPQEWDKKFGDLLIIN